MKRLTLADCAKTIDDQLLVLAPMNHLESLELGNLPLAEHRTAVLKPFAFLTALRLVQRPQAYLADI